MVQFRKLMGSWVSLLLATTSVFPFLFLPNVCFAGIQKTWKVERGFQGSQMNWIDKSGLFLVSNGSVYGFGFQPSKEQDGKFVLAVVHMSSTQVIWTANRGLPVSNSDMFIFGEDGNLSLQQGSTTVWTTNTSGKGVAALELQNSGNLVAVGDNRNSIWQSFDHPTNILVAGQEFKVGMKLVSDPSPTNLTYSLEMKSGDMILSAGFATPQPYWSMQQDTRKTINSDGEPAIMGSIKANSWRFYDANNVFLWQFVFSENTDQNSTWFAMLGPTGFIMFYTLEDGGVHGAFSATQIPSDSCSSPEPCGPYFICGDDNRCQCPAALSAHSACQPNPVINSCDGSKVSTSLVSPGDGLSYFALGFVPPTLRTDINGCKASCQNNCSCRLLFFQNSTGSCFLFNDVGGFRRSNSSSFVAFIKVSTGRGHETTNESHSKQLPFVAIIMIVATVLLILCLVVGFCWYYRRKIKPPEFHPESSEEDNFLEPLAGMPIRFSYQELVTATKNFSVKLGHGGFGSVYQGNLPDGTRLAVKKLEGVGQGKKEFRAEVTIIGSVHHHHLVKLKGFCAEGSHRLLAYEFMAKGSLDKWIFKKCKEDDFLLNWISRFKIALGTAKGLAYLHEECDARIIHCDIKPENVLLDDNLVAKISDFGLAKLMTREQSHVFTTLRGTRGYLAPEWLTNYAISEKSDVYSYGMLLLEIIGGRKNYDASLASEKSHFPSYAFKMVEEGNVRELLDSKLELEEEDESVSTAIKVALWCIQEDTNLRPSMSRVVKMLEGHCAVPHPPTSSPLGTRIFSSFSKSISSEGTSSGPSGSEFNSEAYLSAVRLSGPR